MITYLVTTKSGFLPDGSAIAMIDGTVPGWVPKDDDLHYDHHRPGGGKVQIDELPKSDGSTVLHGNWCIVTTLCDADACVAAAYLQMTEAELLPGVIRKMRAIALDCDYLCIPPTEPEQDLAEFASKAVAALKESSKSLPQELGLPEDRKTWSEEQKVLYSSTAFQRGTEWIIAAANGDRPWPGESGEADAYFAQMQSDIKALRQLKCVRLINGAAFLDMRSINKYVDPRCLVTIAKEMGATAPLTLTARSMTVNLGEEANKILIPGCQYTLGSLPYHEQAATIDLTKVFPNLAEAEKERRGWIGQPPAATTWGGRAAVGGSGWNDASLLTPEEVLAIALN